ncbi:zinc finger CCHC domain-containing protein 18-like [Puntigrus tetrazona]|uniref:zinc finger CCHC domain-containing protein 18-like n=1 Tax=Puntigrus tetrazona TaxID=1606681 RepID=UPI001C8ACDA5|nr:zinc finger CCHC domain-containing protein 18-like [Puntigrus tetrazona]
MEVVELENVIIENSVIIRGLTNTELDEDLTDFLNKHGRICRHLCIDDPKSPYHKDVIVEYSSYSALVTLKPLLPYTLRSPHNVVYHIRLLSSVYASAVTEQTTTHYFAELKKIAKLSGRTFEELLKEQLLSTTAPTAENLNDSNDLESSQTTDPSSSDIPVPPKQAECPEGGQSSDTVHRVITGSFSPTLEVNDVNPPQVQRMVVEHILRSDVVAPSSASFRLRVFSGRIPRPSGEVDYDTWRNSVELLLQDPSLSDLTRSRKILDSLLPPAAEIVKQLGAKALPAAYLDVLDSAFDIVEDGDDLFAKFLNTLQNAGEKPSLYLQRLHTHLLKVMKRGGISAEEADRQLLKQFCRGCWDDALIANLQLEHKRNKPPPFSELLLQLRSEENKHFAKESRMRQHLGTQRQRASSHTVTANPLDLRQDEKSEGTEVAELKRQVAKLQSQLSKQKNKQAGQSELPSTDAVLELKRQVTELQSQMTKLRAQKDPESKSNSSKVKHTNIQFPRENPPKAEHKPPCRPKPGYCFRCGEDGHVASVCEDDPNSSLVNDKRKRLKERQALWDSLYGPSASGSLNTIQPL